MNIGDERCMIHVGPSGTQILWPRRRIPEQDPPMTVEPNPWAEDYEEHERLQEYAHDEDEDGDSDE